jgi:hypothetical protein
MAPARLPDPAGWSLRHGADDGRTLALQAGIVVALVPVALLVVLLVVAPSFLEPMVDPDVAIAGIPAGLVILGLALALTVLGFVVIARWSRSALNILGNIVILVATAVIVLGPAIVLVIKNLGSV